METSLPTPTTTRVYVNLPEGTQRWRNPHYRAADVQRSQGAPHGPSRPAWRWRRPSCLWRGSSLRTDAWPRVVWCWREFYVAWCWLREAGLLGAYPKIPWTRGTRTWFSWIGLPILGCAILTILTPRNCCRWSAIAVTILGRSHILIPNHRPAPMRLLTKTSWPLHSMNPHPCDMILGQDYLILSIYWPRIHLYSLQVEGFHHKHWGDDPINFWDPTDGAT